MALFNFVGEALGEGAFLGILKRAWEWAIKLFGLLGVGDDFRKEVRKRVIDPRSWKDEYFFGLDLAEAEVDPVEKKKLIEQAMEIAQKRDKVEGTTYARNFRVIVTFYDDNPVTVSSPAVPAKPAVPAVPATPAIPATATTLEIPANPGTPAIPAEPARPAVTGTRRPGVIILEEMANTCNTAKEVYARMVAVGLLQDGHTNFEKFETYLKKVALPFLKTEAIAAHAAVSGRLNTWAVEMSKEEVAEKARADAIEAMPKGFKKRFAKLGFELSKYCRI